MKIRKAFKFISKEEVTTPVNDPVGLFVPDQSLSIRDIIQKFAMTGDILGLQNAVDRGFDGTDEFDDEGWSDLQGMDIAELQELRDRAQVILEDYARARQDVVKPKKATKEPETNQDADA